MITPRLLGIGWLTVVLLCLAGNTQAKDAWQLRVAILSDHLGRGIPEPAYVEKLREGLGEGFEVKAWVIGDGGILAPPKAQEQALGEIEEYLPQVMIVTLGSDELVAGIINASSKDLFVSGAEKLTRRLLALPTGPRVLVAPPIIPRGSKTPVPSDLVKSTRRSVVEMSARLWKEGFNAGSLTFNPGDTEGGDLGRFTGRIVSLVQRSFQRPEEGVTVSRGTRRKLEEVDQYYAKIPPLKFSPSPDRWKYLPRTRKRLMEGPRLKIVMLGDSIVNDTARSSYPLLLERVLPKCRIDLVTSVRGSTGCWWYQEGERTKWMVLDQGVDLLIIGGISQRGDVAAISKVIGKVRAAKPETEILLVSGTFGRVDPLDDKVWNEIQNPGAEAYRTKLEALAEELKVAYFDMRLPWAGYVRESGRVTESFHRDPVHANAEGEQILGHLMAVFLTP